MPFFAPSLGSVARNIRKIGTKAFAILDNVIPHEKRIGDLALVKYFLNSNDAFVVMTESVKNDLLDLKPDAKYILTPHPLYDHFGEKLTKETARQMLGIESKQKVLLFFGFIRSYKGLDLLLEAMTKLSNDYLLIIAGEVYGSFNEYDDYIKRNDLNNKVKLFIRYISDEEVKLFFCSSDVCVLPYKSGTQSGIIGISYHFDLPVIATDVGGLAEMINPYRTGIVVGEPKVENIIFGIEQYFQGETSQIYIENIRKYKEIANWKSLAFNIIRFYENI
jgi:glycosyltransferase involved in cell wall biosynthesis